MLPVTRDSDREAKSKGKVFLSAAKQVFRIGRMSFMKFNLTWFRGARIQPQQADLGLYSLIYFYQGVGFCFGNV